MARSHSLVASSATFAVAMALVVGLSGPAVGEPRYNVKGLITPRAQHSYPTGINELGWVVGFTYNTGGVDNLGFIYDGSTIVEIGTLGGTMSRIEAINDHGDIVGASQTTGDSEQHAFLLRNGMMTDLETLGGPGANSTAMKINNLGQIIGVSCVVRIARPAMPSCSMVR